MYHSTYRNVMIWRNPPGTNKLRWYTVGPSFAADTLEGIKSLIRMGKST